MVLTLADEYPVRLLCRVLGVCRSTLYHAPTPPDDAGLRQALLDLAGQWPTYGYRRLTAHLRRDGWAVNPKRVRRLMGELGLLAQPPKRRVRTTHSDHRFGRYPNLVEGLAITHPDHVWVADITYVQLPAEHVYLAVLMDVFTRGIRGWHLGRSLDQTLTLLALERALAVGQPGIHHSDQGVQYAATAYVTRLETLGVKLSMASRGEPRENGYAERLMRTIKEESVALSEFRTFADAQAELGRFLDQVYNVKRIHSSLGYLTPAEFEQQWHRDRSA